MGCIHAFSPYWSQSDFVKAYVEHPLPHKSWLHRQTDTSFISDGVGWILSFHTQIYKLRLVGCGHGNRCTVLDIQGLLSPCPLQQWLPSSDQRYITIPTEIVLYQNAKKGLDFVSIDG